MTTILDSGDRTQFSTGAVRDCSEGKGRCDLLPLNVVAKLLDSDVLFDIHEFKVTNETKWLYEALLECDFFPSYEDMILEVAIQFEMGAKKYGEYNWQKGIPIHSYLDSAIRHFLKHCRGDKDERHDRAFVWNILCAIWTVENNKEYEK